MSANKLMAQDGALLQVAALPVRRRAGATEVLLVTSRDTGRWVIPKGWPMKGRKPHEAAAREALEEAGLKGDVEKRPIGSYTYWKRLTGHFVLVTVDVFLLDVRKQRTAFREAGLRRQAWLTPVEAAKRVDEAALASLLLSLDDSAPV